MGATVELRKSQAGRAERLRLRTAHRVLLALVAAIWAAGIVAEWAVIGRQHQGWVAFAEIGLTTALLAGSGMACAHQIAREIRAASR